MSAFVVIENTPGYLPEGEPAEYDTLAEANGAACELVGELVDEHGYEVVGSSPAGPLSHAAEPLLVALARNEPFSLGRVVEVQKV